MATSPLIALLTDFGLEDGYPGIMKGVMLGIAPQAQFVDITHLIPAQDIAAGAWILHTAWRYFAVGTIFLCVVDPGVGTARRPIALRSAGRFFVGPDNGLFGYVLNEGGPISAVALDRPELHLPNPSSTFHGRDLFAPCAAYLATGMSLALLGSPVDLGTLIGNSTPPPTVQGGILYGVVIHCDHFGNVITNFGADLAKAILAAPDSIVTIGGTAIMGRAATYAAGSSETPFLVTDSSGYLAIAIRGASAATRLGAARGTDVQVTGVSW
jgi:S-adenosyl-L-methionine hydrolase (adenosine-forming)